MTFKLRQAGALSIFLASAFAARGAQANSRYPLAGQVVISPGNASTIVARTTFGMLGTSDGGKSWTWICETAIGYFGAEDPPIAVTGDGSTLVASTIGISVSHDGGCSWTKDPGLSGNPFAVDVTVQPAHADQAFALISRLIDGSYLEWLARSDDNGKTFTETGPPLPNDFVATTVEVAPTNPMRVYVSGKITSTEQGAIQRSDDGGVTWKPSLLDIQGSASIYIGAVDPLDADVVYIRTLSDISSRVIVTRDGGGTWKDIWSASGDVPGLALSADGSTLALGGPTSGVNIASTADDTFRQTSTMGPNCLTWQGNDLIACGNEAIDGFSIGVSHDEGAHFTPLLHLADIVPRACPAGSAGQACATDWGPVALQIGVDAGGSVDASVSGRNPELNPVGDESPPRGCSCRVGPRNATRGTTALPTVLLLLLSKVRRRSRRQGHFDAVRPAS